MARILVVDEVRWQWLIEDALGKEGHRVRTVGGIADAVDWLLQEENFDALLVDWKFSCDLLRLCSKYWPERMPETVLILILENDLSVKTCIHDQLQGIYLPALHWLEKSCCREELRQAVKAALARQGERVLVNN